MTVFMSLFKLGLQSFVFALVEHEVSLFKLRFLVARRLEFDEFGDVREFYLFVQTNEIGLDLTGFHQVNPSQ